MRRAWILAVLRLMCGGIIATEASTFDPESPCHVHRGRGKKALLTGVTGMLGSHIAEALLERGFVVYGVVRARSNMRNIGAFSSKIEVLTADLMDPWRTLSIVRKVEPDYVLHFAAQAFNSVSHEEPAHTLTTNVMTTLNLLEAIRQLPRPSDVRMLVAGSSTVYGTSTEEWDGPIPESAPLKPVSPYGVSKVASEALALQYARMHGLHVIVPRFFIHLAPRGVEALALHEFARQIALIERSLQPPVVRHGDISTLRDITDIVDSAPAVVCLAEIAPNLTVVNVGSNTSYSIANLLDRAIAASTMSDRIRREADVSRLRPYDERTVLADISLLRSLTGWQPQPDIDHLIGLLLEYWRREIEFRHAPGASSSRVGNAEDHAEL